MWFDNVAVERFAGVLRDRRAGYRHGIAVQFAGL